ncbi:MAG: hypothetical protein R2743_10130 [Ilumatobacteraceae bacterium]
MVMAADEIAAIVARGRTAFDDDVVLRRAVERCLEIMGEASKTVSIPVSSGRWPRSMSRASRRAFERSSSRAESNAAAGGSKAIDFLHRSCTGFSGTVRSRHHPADSADDRTAPELGKRNPQDGPDGS